MSAPNFSCRHNAQYIYGFCEHSDFEKYVEDNKELRRRYPKHAWPDNPLEAQPVRGVKR